MRARIGVLLAAGALVLAVTSPAHAAGGSSITGTVTLNGIHVAGVEVDVYRLDDLDDAIDTVDQTSSTGTYLMTGIAAGTYWIFGTTPTTGGHSSFLGKVTVTGSGTVTDDFTLLLEFHCSVQFSGRPNVGQTLGEQTTRDVNEPVTYAAGGWYRFATDSSTYVQVGQPGTSYTLVDADQGHQMGYYSVIWNAANGRSGTCFTPDDTPAIGPRIAALTSAPVVVGKHKVGKVLTASATSDPAATVRYQWFRVVKKKHHHVATKSIGGATGPTYKLKRKDGGMKVFVQVTGSGGGDAATTEASAATKVHR